MLRIYGSIDTRLRTRPATTTGVARPSGTHGQGTVRARKALGVLGFHFRWGPP